MARIVLPQAASHKGRGALTTNDTRKVIGEIALASSDA